jgi:hypothetical protein
MVNRLEWIGGIEQMRVADGADKSQRGFRGLNISAQISSDRCTLNVAREPDHETIQYGLLVSDRVNLLALA